MKIGIVQCTSKKKDGKHKAKELYMESPLFRAQRRYVESKNLPWLILSAKYGLISPEKRIHSYDRHITDGYPSMKAEIIQERIDNIFKNARPGEFRTINSVQEKPIMPDEKIEFVILAGQEYFERLEWYLNNYDLEYNRPFKGMKLKEREQAMIEAAREKENNSITSYA